MSYFFLKNLSSTAFHRGQYKQFTTFTMRKWWDQNAQFRQNPAYRWVCLFLWTGSRLCCWEMTLNFLEHWLGTQELVVASHISWCLTLLQLRLPGTAYCKENQYSPWCQHLLVFFLGQIKVKVMILHGTKMKSPCHMDYCLCMWTKPATRYQ